MSTKGFRFGLNASTAPNRKEWVEKAKKAEDLGYDILLAGEHTFIWQSPFPALQAAADVTSRLRIGTYVLGNDFRNPIMLAQEAATLDILSDGRFELGLGTGWLINDYQNTGIPFDSPGVRISRMQEAVQILKCAFSGESFSFQGKYYHVDNFQLPGWPVQRPRPPLLIGGGGKRILSFAAREVDIIGINLLSTSDGWIDLATGTKQATANKIDWVRHAAAGRTDMELSIYFITTEIADSNEEKEKAAYKIRADWGVPEEKLSLQDLLASPYVLIGSENELVEKMLRLREEFGFTYFVFWEPLEVGAHLIKRLKS